MSILQTIIEMERSGYPAAAILATIRSGLEAEERQEDAYQSEQEAESRRRLAVLARFGETRDPFGEVA